MFSKEYVTKDVEQIDVNSKFFPSLVYSKLFSDGNDLKGFVLRAQGEGPHPTAILLHGFPGYDDPIDLAHALRRCGMNVLRFHYRGSWGVGGGFSFTHCIEDVKAAIDYLVDEKTVEEFNIDVDNLFLIGHSMGGFLTLTNCMDERIKASVAISPYDFGLIGKIGHYDEAEKNEAFSMYVTAQPPLTGTSPEALMQECLDNGEKWNLPGNAAVLAEQKLLITVGTGDTVSKRYLHHDKLAEEIKKYNKNNLTEIFADTDHSYSNKRIWLAQTIADYLEKVINE